MKIVQMVRNKRARWFLLVAVLIILPLLPQFASRYVITLVNLCLIYAVFAMSLDLLAGYMGNASLGHACFFGVAGYSVAIASTRFGWGVASAVPFALLVTLVVALIFGLMVSKLSGVTFVLVNLGLGQIVWGIAYRWYTLTGGDDGIRGIRRPIIGGVALTGESYYYFVLAIFLICTALLFLFVNSPFGQSVRGIKQSMSRMRGLGYNVWLHRYITYVVAGFFAGVAGILSVYFLNYIAPTSLELIVSARAQLMVLLGGSGTLFGPMLGAIIVVFLENVISVYTQRWLLIMGVIYVLAVKFLPNGIYGLLRGWLSNLSKKKKINGISDEHIEA